MHSCKTEKHYECVKIKGSMGIKGIWSWYIVRVLNFKQHVITGNEKINILVWSHILGKSYFFVSKVIKCELKYNLGSFTWIQYMLHPSGAGIGASHGWYCKEWWVCLLLTATGRFVISLFSFSEEDEYDTHLPSNLIKLSRRLNLVVIYKLKLLFQQSL